MSAFQPLEDGGREIIFAYQGYVKPEPKKKVTKILKDDLLCFGVVCTSVIYKE